MIILKPKLRKVFFRCRFLIVAERQSAFSLIVACVGGRPGFRLRSRAVFERMEESDWTPFKNLSPDPWPRVKVLLEAADKSRATARWCCP
jgi:hypothetical protein